MSNITRRYSDLDAVFAPNPGNSDLSLRKDASAVKFAVKNLIMTMHYERPFASDIGSQVRQMLFEPIDDMTFIVLERLIVRTLQNHEPRIVVDRVVINEVDEGNAISIDIQFTIINTDRPLNVNLTLDRTR